MKVLTVVGARSQFAKAAVLCKLFQDKKTIANFQMLLNKIN
ncbi:hypothetical protein N9Y79_01825 [Alphaproteobacteria bacterium]|nr:hypothetical protein [Alphaproteobacteria bacterium]